MTTANRELFELCKRVYEATGWDGTDKCRAYLKNPYVDVWDWETIPCHEDNIADVDEWYPLYTSDYLLEKLPVGTNISKTNTDTTEPSIYYLATCRNNGIHQGGTPLKALLKLTLKLYEEELL